MTEYIIYNDAGLSVTVEYDTLAEARQFAREAYGTVQVRRKR